MQIAERGQSWRIHITSKARNFNFKFRFRFNSTSFRPTWTLSSCRLSIVLKLRNFILRINSKPTISPKNINSQPTFTTQPKNGREFIQGRVMKIVQKFRARLAKIRPKIAAKPESHPVYPKDPIYTGLSVVVFLAFLAQSILKNGQKGVMMVASAGVFVASLLFKKFNTVKLIVKLATLPLLVLAIACYLFFNFDNNYCDYIAWSWSSLNKIANL